MKAFEAAFGRCVGVGCACSDGGVDEELLRGEHPVHPMESVAARSSEVELDAGPVPVRSMTAQPSVNAVTVQIPLTTLGPGSSKPALIRPQQRTLAGHGRARW